MNRRGASKTYVGGIAKLMTFDDIQECPMALRNHVVARAHIVQEVLCAVLKDGESVHFENRMGFNAGEYAKQAFAKFGKCRVIFYEANEAKTWREFRWKNANVGSMYRRPSFMNVEADKVPDNLQLAAMLL